MRILHWLNQRLDRAAVWLVRQVEKVVVLPGRSRPGSVPNPEALFRVEVTDEAVGVTAPNGQTDSVRWDALECVRIVTTSEGPFQPDVFIVLDATDGRCVVPQGASGDEDRLLEKLNTLPGFDFEKAIEAMSCTDDREFVCWQKERR